MESPLKVIIALCNRRATHNCSIANAASPVRRVASLSPEAVFVAFVVDQQITPSASSLTRRSKPPNVNRWARSFYVSIFKQLAY